MIVQPFNESGEKVFARISALRESLTGTGVSSAALLSDKTAILCCSAFSAVYTHTAGM